MRFPVWKADEGAWMAADDDGESGEMDGGACGEECGRRYEAVALLRRSNEVMKWRGKDKDKDEDEEKSDESGLPEFWEAESATADSST